MRELTINFEEKLTEAEDLLSGINHAFDYFLNTLGFSGGSYQNSGC